MLLMRSNVLNSLVKNTYLMCIHVHPPSVIVFRDPRSYIRYTSLHFRLLHKVPCQFPPISAHVTLKGKFNPVNVGMKYLIDGDTVATGAILCYTSCLSQHNDDFFEKVVGCSVLVPI